MKFRLLPAGTCWLMLSGVVAAQEQPKTPAAAPAAAAASQPAAAQPPAAQPANTQPAAANEQQPPASGAAAEFARQFEEWKKLLARLRELQVQYKTAKPEERDAMVKEYDELLAQGDALIPTITAAAETAYKAAPNQDTELGKFLTSALKDRLNRSDYSAAARIAGLLVDNNYSEKAVINSAAMAAFYADEFDAAEKYLNQATEAKVIDAVGRKAQAELAIRKQEAQADDLPRVLLKTSKGDITIELLENEAPNTVANFVSLVEKGYYNGLTFHRVLDGFMAQGGDPKGDGSGGPGYNIPDEHTLPNHRKHFAGSLSMAKTNAPNSGGSQFFLTFTNTDHLDGMHTVFGRVIQGMDVLPKIQRIDPDAEQKPAPDKILEAKVLRKRDHEYQPKTLPE